MKSASFSELIYIICFKEIVSLSGFENGGSQCVTIVFGPHKGTKANEGAQSALRSVDTKGEEVYVRIFEDTAARV
jgi:hypothetical protein